MHILLTGNTTFKLANFRAGLISRLIKDGHRVTVMAPPDDYVATIRQMGCDFAPLDMDRNGVSPLAEMRLFYTIFLNLYHKRPSFVFSYTIKNNIYSGLACRFLGIPFAANVTGLGPAFNQAGLFNRLIRFLYQLSFRRAAAVFFQNEDDRATFLEGNLVPDKAVHLLPGSGVDLTRFSPEPLPSLDEGVRFLLVARMLWDKGVGLSPKRRKRSDDRIPTPTFNCWGHWILIAKPGFHKVKSNDGSTRAVSFTSVPPWMCALLFDKHTASFFLPTTGREHPAHCSKLRQPAVRS